MPEDDLKIHEQIDGSKGRWSIHHPEGAAEMTFSIASDSLRIVDHTQVPVSLRGKGYAHALYRHMVDQARAQGFKVVPLCPYVSAQMARNPQDADVFQA